MNPSVTTAPTMPRPVQPITAAPSRPVVNDVAKVAAQPTNVPAQANRVAAGTLTPSIVSNIPLRNPDAPKQSAQAKPISEDDELDKIMQDVGQELKKVGQKTNKGIFSFLTKKPKPKSRLTSAATKPQSKAAANASQIKTTPQVPASAASLPKVKVAAQPKPVKQHAVPILPIFLALGATLGLIVAAYSAFN